MADKKKKDEELLQYAGNSALNLANSLAGKLGTAVELNPAVKAALNKANTSFADNTAKASNTDLTPKAPTLEQPVKPTAFSYDPYVENEAVKAAQANMGKYSNGFTPDANYDALMAQYQQLYGNRPANFNFTKQAQMDDYFNQLLNRKDFEYDLNGDMLYQQYKDRYMQQGQQAMMDTMGQAQAMTGGYGNSYAQQAGQQAYQGYLQGLNDKIPELYNLALQRYQMEGDKLQNAYNMLGNERNFAYGQYQDQLGQWNTDVNRALDVAQNERNFQRSSFDADRANAQDMYFNLANQDYGRYSDAYDRAIQQYAQDVANYQWQSQFNEGVRQSDIDNALRQAQFDESVKQNTIGNEQWQKQFDETVKQNDIDNAFRQSQADLEEERWNKEFDFENKQFEQAVKEWTAEFGLDKQKFNAQLEQWKAEFGLDQQQVAEAKRQFDEEMKLQRDKFEQDKKTDQTSIDTAINTAIEQYQTENQNGAKTVSDFTSSVLTPEEFARRGMKADVNGTSTKFSSYADYVEAVAKKWYDAGDLGLNQLEDLMDSEWWRNRMGR